MTKLPDSLRRILDKQKPQAEPAPKPEPRGYVTTIWRDGEIWREDPNGKLRQFKSIPPLQ